MLRGSYTATIDDKGRVKIPAAFKRHLEQSYGTADYYVTSLDGGYVRVYPIAEWEKIEAKLSELPSMDTARRKFLDRTNYYGQVQTLDSAGRILVPTGLRASAELAGEIQVFGYLTYLDIWSAERFRSQRLGAAFTDEDAEALARLGI